MSRELRPLHWLSFIDRSTVGGTAIVIAMFNRAFLRDVSNLCVVAATPGDLVTHLISVDLDERYDIQDYMFIHCTRILRIRQRLDAANGIPPIFDSVHVESFSCGKPKAKAA
ncbi:hypothetical protein RRG08_052147 [Elysia crispata]|uniref:Uncharacterized protein n=1 Tax=Elysia crispata TaxID=231223 RepID=A0AAE1DH83_9GAST|nr:hypothetical protein RRG08_052147 [Elysia crispata]